MELGFNKRHSLTRREARRHLERPGMAAAHPVDYRRPRKSSIDLPLAARRPMRARRRRASDGAMPDVAMSTRNRNAHGAYFIRAKRAACRRRHAGCAY